MENEGWGYVGLVKFTKYAMWDESERHKGYWLGRDKGDGREIDSPMYFIWGNVSYPRPNETEWCLGKFWELVYVNDVSEQNCSWNNDYTI